MSNNAPILAENSLGAEGDGELLLSVTQIAFNLLDAEVEFVGGRGERAQQFVADGVVVDMLVEGGVDAVQATLHILNLAHYFAHLPGVVFHHTY